MERTQGRQIPWALKEWSVICQAFETGQQTITLRKGGIEEESGEFRAQHHEFLLFPTQEHQKASALCDPHILTSGKTESPTHISFRLFARIELTLTIQSADQARALAPWTLWTPDYLAQRFALYPDKPLLLLLLRLYRLPTPYDLPHDPSYAGCRSWVPLIRAPEIPASLTPILSEEKFNTVRKMLQKGLAH